MLFSNSFYFKSVYQLNICPEEKILRRTVACGRNKKYLNFLLLSVFELNFCLSFSAPDKPFSGKDVHRVGAFVQQYHKDKLLDTDDIPFLSLLQQNKPELKLKADAARTEPSRAARNDGSKTDTSESALSESKTSVSSQASAPDDFVMVELVGGSEFDFSQF